MIADSALVTAAVAGDHSAFSSLVQQYQDRIARYILRLVHDEELALDLTQDTFVAAFRHLSSLRTDIAFSAWLYRIATNLVIQSRSKSRRIQWHPLADIENTNWGATASPDTAVIDRELVYEALSQLPKERAACLLLHIKEGFSYDEVAVIMGSTPEAVRKRIARAKDQFRTFYNAASEENVVYAVR